ncbi:hypothetical protein L9F63_011679, partial [Diploptera punctata]
LRMPMPELEKPAPQFTNTAVVNGEFKEISLTDFKGQYVVLFFYPLDLNISLLLLLLLLLLCSSTFVCPTELIAFSDRAEEFKKINC